MTDLAQHGGQRQETEFLGWLGSGDFEDEGDFVLGRIEGRDENENGKFLRMVREDGARFNLSIPTHVEQNFSVSELVGEIVAVQYREDMDVGRPQPMKVYDVYTFGAWPDVMGLEADAPF